MMIGKRLTIQEMILIALDGGSVEFELTYVDGSKFHADIGEAIEILNDETPVDEEAMPGLDHMGDYWAFDEGDLKKAYLYNECDSKTGAKAVFY